MAHSHDHSSCHHRPADEKAVDAMAVFKAKEQFKPWKFELNPLGPNDVEIRITHCGMCRSDLHTVDGDWGDQIWPIVPGHEIIGFVSAVGAGVKEFKVGQRVGVGPQAISCKKCRFCTTGHEVYCEKGFVGSYGSKLDDGYVTKGGYALYNRTDAHFVFPIPDSLDSAETAPILCAGITCYYPLKELNVKQGSRVGIIGIGGLGHLGIQLAHALGAEVTAISSTADKEAEAKSFGASKFVCSANAEQLFAARGSFDVVLNTISAQIPWTDYLELMAPHGTWVQLGMPNSVSFSPSDVVMRGLSFRGSLIGPPGYMREMLELCGRHKIKAKVECVPLKEVEVARKKVMDNSMRYRMVLVMPELH